MQTKRTGTGFSVIVPCYNEEESIEPCILALERDLSQDHPYEIIVVNDGSTDSTGDIVEELKQVAKDVRVIQHIKNKGYGAALKSGIREALYDVIVIMDADGTYPSESVSDLVSMSSQFDMVVGSRADAKASIPWIRRPAKWVITWLASYLSAHRIPDLNSGLRAFRRGPAEEFLAILPDGFSFTTTITLAMLASDYRVEYIPIEYHRRTGRSKIRPIRDTLNFMQLIVRMVMYFNPLRVFIPLSLMLFLASFCALVYRAIVGKGAAALSVILFVAGIQVFTTGMIADLIDRRLVLSRSRANQNK